MDKKEISDIADAIIVKVICTGLMIFIAVPLLLMTGGIFLATLFNFFNFITGAG